MKWKIFPFSHISLSMNRGLEIHHFLILNASSLKSLWSGGPSNLLVPAVEPDETTSNEIKDR